MDKCYIVLHEDGCMMTFNSQQRKEDFQKGVRFFEVEPDTHIFDICSWIRDGHEDTTKITEVK